MERVTAATDKIRRRIDASNGNGSLGLFNRAYRERRTVAMREGRHMIPYGLALHRLRLAMADAAATKAAGGDVAVHADLLAKVFGPD